MSVGETAKQRRGGYHQVVLFGVGGGRQGRKERKSRREGEME